MSEPLTRASEKRLPRIVRRALLGAGIAVAAGVGSAAFGFGSTAWAADSAPDGLGSLVSGVTDPLIGGPDSLLGSSPVATVVEPVAATTDTLLDSVPVVAPVVDVALPDAPVQTVLSPVVDTVDSTLEQVGSTVQTVVDEAGGVVDEVGGVVDEVGGVVETTVPPIADPDVPGPRAADDPTTSAGARPAEASSVDTPATSAALTGPSKAFAGSALPDWDEQMEPSTPLAGASVSAHEEPAGAPTTGGAAHVTLSSSTTAGSGGSSPAGPVGDRTGAPRSPSLTSAVSAAAGDDALPASATFDTDSSPD